MNKYDVNRKNLYDDLINMGYFRDEDGSIVMRMVRLLSRKKTS